MLILFKVKGNLFEGEHGYRPVRIPFAQPKKPQLGKS